MPKKHSIQAVKAFLAYEVYADLDLEEFSADYSLLLVSSETLANQVVEALDSDAEIKPYVKNWGSHGFSYDFNSRLSIQKNRNGIHTTLEEALDDIRNQFGMSSEDNEDDDTTDVE